VKLENEWRARLASGSIESPMRFAEAGLVLGAGTVLCPALAARRQVSIDEPRLLALLGAAHLRKTTPLGLAHIRKATKCWSEGNEALASMHLALSGLDHLKQPVPDAQRLFIADHLLRKGFQPSTLIQALGLETPNDSLAKYNQDEPRVPAGSGRTSGQWTTGAESSFDSSSVAPDSAARAQNRSDESIAAAPASRRQATAQDRGAPTFTVEILPAIVTPAASSSFTPFGSAVSAMADEIEVADSITKWRELGPKGEESVREAVAARGWTVLATQVYVRTSLGLRVADFLVHIPAGMAGNLTAYDGFIEVKVNGGRYNSLQRDKDALIGTVGGVLLTPVPGYRAGSKITLETALANVTITYERE